MSGRFVWMVTGGIVLPTVVLVALVLEATLKREEWVELRVAQLDRSRAEAGARRLSHWVEARAGRVLEQAVPLTGDAADEAPAAQELSRLETGEPVVRHLFVLDRQGSLLWPVLPVPSLARSLPMQEAPTYPLLLRSLSPPWTDSTTTRPLRDRYLQAIEIYRPLLRQSDPWMRLVASDLIARCYSRLQAWPQALALYRDMAREFGQGQDAGGVPIALGVEFEIANIHYRMGAYRRFLEGYLATYEQLVDRDFALPEPQRRYLATVTRKALAGYFGSHPGAPAELAARFDQVRRLEQATLRREAFIRSLWSHGVGRAIAAAAGDRARGHLVRQIDGEPVTFFWRRARGRLVGLQLDLPDLVAELGEAGVLASEEGFGTVLRSLSGQVLAGQTDGGAPIWGGRVDVLPLWEVGVVPSGDRTPAAGGQALLVWLAMLSVVGLGGGLYGVTRTVSGRLHTARLQADFVASVTHELRTPLTSIRMFCELLLDGGDADEGRRRGFLQHILRESQRLERVVRNVLSFSRSERGELSLDFATVDLAELAAHVVATCRDAARQQGVDLRLSVGTGVPPVWGDADRIESAVCDLVDNALRYGGTGQEVEVTLAGRNGRVALSVADRGPGVPARERRRIFQPFFRGREGMAQARSGTGLGLALVRRIAQGHGGSVELAPRPGGGSVFTLVLPAANQGERGGAYPRRG